MVFVILQLAFTAMLAGLCWTVQAVVYPQFANVPEAGFPRYHAQHSRRITWVVGPLMIAELLLGVLFVIEPPINPILAWALLGLTGVVWLSTAFVQVPMHAQLERHGANQQVIAQLVRSNWIRTGAWTARAMVLSGIVMHWVTQASG